MARPLFSPTQTNVARLTEVCPVVPGATVSKPLLNEPWLRQVVFAMDAGQELTEHRTPFPAVVQMIDGRIDFTIEGETHTLEADGWLVMPPNAPHALVAKQPSRFMLTLARPDAGDES